MITKKHQENIQKFVCLSCDFSCCKKGDYNRHITTSKHLKIMIMVNNGKKKTSETEFVQIYKCLCGKEYKFLSGLSRHKKSCNKLEDFESSNKEEENNELNETDKESEKQLIYKLVQQNMELVLQNQEFKQMLIEQNKNTNELQKQMIEIASKTNITNNNNCNNTTNNKFNMNIFLNETCKDAMNIMDFVTSLPLTLQDLEETGKQGYVKGLSRILVNGLKDIDVSKRPIHCSDLKRETLYVKDNNMWEKEDAEKNRIKNAIKYISLKNAKQITQWTKVKENEGYRDSYNKKSDVYLKLVYEANGGDDDELNKIIKNITPNVTIDKNEIIY
jgi:hypothetical protein